MENYDLLWGFLKEFFNYEEYKMAVRNAKKKISNVSAYQKNWNEILKMIQNRELLFGQPLNLVNQAANQVLDENSDEEAYVWLDKMVKNIERADNIIEEY